MRIWSVTVALLLGILAIGIDELVISPVLTDISATLHCGVDTAALGVTAYGISIGIAGPLLSPLGDRWPRRHIIAGGLAVFTLASMVCAGSPNAATFLLARALCGIAAGAVVPSAYALAGDMSAPECRGRVMGIVMSGWSLALIVGIPISGAVAEKFGWRTTLRLISALGAVSAACVAVLAPRRGDHVHPPSGTGSRLKLPRLSWAETRSIVSLLGATFCDMFGFYGAYTFLGPHIRAVLQTGSDFTGILMMSYGLGLASSPLFGRLADAWGHRKTLLTGLVVLTMALALLPHVSIRATTVVPALFIWGTCQGAVLTCLTTLLSEMSHEHRGQVMGLYSLATNVAAAVAGALLGQVFVVRGFAWVSYICAVVTLAGTAFLLQFARQRAQGLSDDGEEE